MAITLCEVCQQNDFAPLATMWSPIIAGLRLPVAICRACGFITVHPRPPAGSFRRFNARWFEDEAKTPGQSPHTVSRWQTLWSRIQDLYPSGPRAILDIGARHGDALAYLKTVAPAADLAAVELIPEFHPNLRRLGAEVHAVDLEAPWPAALKSRFDLIIFRHTLEHLEAPLEALRNIASALTPEGMVYIAVPNAMQIRPGHPMRTDWFRPIHAHYFNQSTLIGLCARAGLVPARCKPEREIWGLFGSRPQSEDFTRISYPAQREFMEDRLRQCRRADAVAIARLLVGQTLRKLGLRKSRGAGAPRDGDDS